MLLLPSIHAFHCLTIAAAAALMLSGCDSDSNQEAQMNLGDTPPKVDTPYSVWPSARQITAYELGDLLKADENAANKLCQTDSNRLAGYSQHLALVSTQSFDRADIADQYGLDSTLPVSFGNTGRMLVPSLGGFLEQDVRVDPNNAAASEAIKLTFSEKGRFTGYCEETKGYTNVVNVIDSEGKLTLFSTRCDQKAVTVCMSVR